jgi:hypothetical protein
MWQCELASPITQVVGVRQMQIALAAGTDAGMVHFISAAGKVLMEILYDGGIDDLENAGAVRPSRRRCFCKLATGDDSQTPKFPACSTITASRDTRSIAIGYRDGMIQVFDCVQKRICRRMSAHGTVVKTIVIHPRQPRLISTSVAHSLRFDAAHGRYVSHQGENNAAAVKNAFASS